MHIQSRYPPPACLDPLVATCHHRSRCRQPPSPPLGLDVARPECCRAWSPGLDVAGGPLPPAPPDAYHAPICSQQSRQASAEPRWVIDISDRLDASAHRLQSQRFALRNTCRRLSHLFVRRNHRRIANRSHIFISCTALSHLLAYPIVHRCESNS